MTTSNLNYDDPLARKLSPISTTKVLMLRHLKEEEESSPPP
jgi:hypothetical protein